MLVPAALATALLISTAAQDPTARTEPEPVAGAWQAWLDSPGGRLEFGLWLEREDGRLGAALSNGEERLPVASVAWRDGHLRLRFDPYDSEVLARPSRDGRVLDGSWSKRSGERTVNMGFHARALSAGEPTPLEPAASTQRTLLPVRGRWAVDFSSSEQPAVAVFEAGRAEDPWVAGTFLTTLGDYRFLDGRWDARTRSLRLSCFDGAHAFLFSAALDDAGQLRGDFWSSDAWHETWTARRDDDASLPDPFGITRWNADVRLADLRYPDLAGALRSLDDPAFRARARVIKLFGTWCPNCNDEAPFLADLERRYRARGLGVLGLAFEHGDDHAYAAGRVRAYVSKHGIEFPVLIAGTSDKQAASAAFPLLDRVRAYPTTLFLDGSGAVRAVHTGFAGPATGHEHVKLKADFERLIEQLLDEGTQGR